MFCTFLAFFQDSLTKIGMDISWRKTQHVCGLLLLGMFDPQRVEPKKCVCVCV